MAKVEPALPFVAIKGKAGPLGPKMTNSPEHVCSIQFVETVAGINQNGDDGVFVGIGRRRGLWHLGSPVIFWLCGQHGLIRI